jgi:hypothetical protein
MVRDKVAQIQATLSFGTTLTLDVAEAARLRDEIGRAVRHLNKHGGNKFIRVGECDLRIQK